MSLFCLGLARLVFVAYKNLGKLLQVDNMQSDEPSEPYKENLQSYDDNVQADEASMNSIDVS